jgi:hypothetical protein
VATFNKEAFIFLLFIHANSSPVLQLLSSQN